MIISSELQPTSKYNHKTFNSHTMIMELEHSNKNIKLANISIDISIKEIFYSVDSKEE
jgi:hypothetical protein